jgi:hypothetical protein
MDRTTLTRPIALTASLLLAAVLGAAAAASTANHDGDAAKRAVSRIGQERVPGTGPVVALYVVDHRGDQPDLSELVPYRNAFRKVLAGCWINATTLASAVFWMSDRASLGSGVEFDNLAVLEAMARHVGPRKQNCNDDFWVIEARLIGSAA